MGPISGKGMYPDENGSKAGVAISLSSLMASRTAKLTHMVRAFGLEAVGHMGDGEKDEELTVST